MAEALLYPENLCCAICLDLLKDPVAIPCGHSYCMGCINGYWDQDDHTGVYSCPHCRQTFTPRPVLRKNIMLAEVVEQLKKTGLQAAPPVNCYAGPGDTACDVCTGKKRKAIKSCLVCLASYCKDHLRPHYKSSAFKKHKLVKATGNLQEKICSHHDKVLEVYCRTDQMCICYLCAIENHRGHDTVSSAEERTEKWKQLGATQSKFQQRIQEREKELQDLRQAVQLLKLSALAAVVESQMVFTDLICSLKRKCSEVIHMIRHQETAEVSRAEGLLEQLEQEIAELRRRDAELEKLSHTEDHIHFLQSCQSVSAPPGPSDLPSITFNPNFCFELPNKSVYELMDQLEDVFKGEFFKVSESVKEVSILQIPQPEVREEFLQYYCHLTLDPNSANSKLSLSTEDREVTRVKQSLSHPDHPARFDYWEQVLCREGLSGRHYWEVEWTGKGTVYIAVSYLGMMRKGWGYNALFGYNDKSWSLWCSPSKCYFYHNQKYKSLPTPLSSRVGVYLDHRAGTLSFYSVSDTMTLLHRVQTTFAQPLYPGFYANTAEATITLSPLALEGLMYGIQVS